MKALSVLMLAFSLFILIPAAPAETAEQDHPVAAFTLKTVADGEKFLFVGVGGKIDGVINPVLPVKLWDIVKITLINHDGINHHITLPDFFITSEEISEKGTKTVLTFVPFKKGGYGYYCILEGHRKLGMEGLMTVSRR